MKRRVRVGLLFGGQSGEHEVSLASAQSVLAALDPEKYEAVPIGITREGQWLMADRPEQLLAAEVTAELPGTDEALPDVTHHGIVRANERGGIDLHQTAVDVVFPLLHGPRGEDGTVQGLLELAGIPYVGAGVLGSSLSMDKSMMKDIFMQAGLPSVRYRTLRAREWAGRRNEVVDEIEANFTYPVFVKPCNLGSSVGISKTHDRDELLSFVDLAFEFDRRVVVEEGVDAREIELSVLGNDEPIVSVPGEVVAHREYYDYEAKYTEGLADLIIPAQLTSDQTRRLQEFATRAFLAVDCAGLARVDFFLRRSNGEILVNEINTIPGFTATSMYPKLWEASGLPYPELIDRLIELAFERHQENDRHRRTR